MTIYLPLPPMAKARPRVTRNGTFMPKRYQDWRKSFVLLWRKAKGARGLTGTLEVKVWFCTKTGTMRPDVDNAYSACLDAMQDAGAFVNDRQVRCGSFEVMKANEVDPPGILITMNEMGEQTSNAIRRGYSFPH